MLAMLGAGHINIVRPLEVVLTSRHLAFITEYVPGEQARHPQLADRIAALAPNSLCQNLSSGTEPGYSSVRLLASSFCPDMQCSCSAAEASHMVE